MTLNNYTYWNSTKMRWIKYIRATFGCITSNTCKVLRKRPCSFDFVRHESSNAFKELFKTFFCILPAWRLVNNWAFVLCSMNLVCPCCRFKLASCANLIVRAMLFHWLAAVQNSDYDWSNLTASSGLIPLGWRALYSVYKKTLPFEI